MVPLGLFNSRNFAGANLMTLAMYGALGGFFFALVIYLQTTLHYPAIKAGLSLLPVTILLLLFSKRVGKWSAEVGPRWFMTLGPLISSVGIAWMLRLGPHTSSFVFDVLPGVMLFSIGLAIFVAPLTSTVMGSVSENSSGIASGISNAVARSASLIVVALLGLFGSDDVFRFAMILCATLAAIAGIISFLMIKNPPRPKVLKAKPVL
jgi:sugar phosphate permease